jgi:N-carbamoyl-L-amino-acid hydrolase
VIPGKVVLSLEIRDLDAAKMTTVYDAIHAEADKIAQARQTPFTFTQLKVSSEPAPTDPRLPAHHRQGCELAESHEQSHAERSGA